MKNYTIRRILQLIPVLFGISVLIFAVMKMIPGDVISGILGVEATPELRAQLAAKYGLDRPYIVQYLDWIVGVLHGDFGESIRTSAPILPEILSRFKVTAELTIMAAVISWCIAIPLGVLAAVKRNTFADRFVRVFALLGVSVPGFALSILLILVLSLAFNYFPPLGYVGFFEDPLRNLQIMILPAAILGVSISGSVMRMTCSSVLEVLRQDFIKTVRAKGASERVAIFKHALRNALIPIITLIGMQFPAGRRRHCGADFFPARPWSDDADRHQSAGLPRGAGLCPVHRLCLRAGESGDRPALRLYRPAYFLRLR